MARAACAKTGKPIRAQMEELIALRRWGIHADEYYTYRLFDDRRFTPQQKREYTGRHFQWQPDRALNDPGLAGRSGISGSWVGMIGKLLFDGLMLVAAATKPLVVSTFDTATA